MSRSKFLQAFPRGTAFLPVIHIENAEQALRNAEYAFAGGADGIFLIGHDGMRWSTVHTLYAAVRQAHPGGWIGLNCLDLPPEHAAAMLPRSANGLWTDNAKIKQPYNGPQPQAAKVTAALRDTVPNALYFGGVAFKYQGPVEDLDSATRAALPHVDVITTSGPATGKSPEPAKLRRMRDTAGDHPIALASGVTPNNVHDFLPYVDAFLVATRISKSFYEFDPHLLAALADEVRNKPQT